MPPIKAGTGGSPTGLEKKEAWDRILEFWKKKEGGPGGSPSDLENRILCSFKGRGSELSPTLRKKKLKRVPGGSPPDFEIYHSVPLMGGAVTSPPDLEKKMKEGAREVSPRFEIEIFFASGAPECT